MESRRSIVLLTCRHLLWFGLLHRTIILGFQKLPLHLRACRFELSVCIRILLWLLHANWCLVLGRELRRLYLIGLNNLHDGNLRRLSFESLFLEFFSLFLLFLAQGQFIGYVGVMRLDFRAVRNTKTGPFLESGDSDGP